MKTILTQIQKGMINAFLRRMYKYHIVSECFDIDSIVDDMDRKFCKVLFSPVHCLHSLLPPVKSNAQGSVLETTTFSSQSATVFVASLLSYVVFFDLNRHFSSM